MTPIVQICKLHFVPNTTIHCNTQNHSIVCTKSRIYLRFAYICCPGVLHLLDICILIYWWCMLYIWTMEVTSSYPDECYISGRLLHIWTMEVTNLGNSYISGRWCYMSWRLLHIWTIEVTYLDDCYISERSRLHIWTTVTYLNDRGYISGRLLHIWTMEVTHLDDRYISCRISWRLQIWTSHVASTNFSRKMLLSAFQAPPCREIAPLRFRPGYYSWAYDDVMTWKHLIVCSGELTGGA